ncbi:MAG: GerMN domain-containing protein [Caldisericia bacterium]|nr:GerMN domain-containing protein [Caldisericia bacterium]
MGKRNGYILNSYSYKRKQQSKVFGIVVVLILIGIGYYFFQHRFDMKIQSARLYFYDSSKQELVPNNRKISLSGQTEKIVKILIDELSTPPENENLQTFIPSYGRISDVTLNDGVCELVLEGDMVSDSIHTVSEEAAAVYSIVNTLTELENIQKVKLSINGNKSPYFKQYISIADPLVRLSGQLPNGKLVRLFYYYYPSDSYITKNKEIPSSEDSQDLIYSIVNQLMIGFKDIPEITNFFPSDVSINNVEIQNGCANIDLSAEFRRFLYGATEELCLINTIVLSVTELPDVNRVKILIDGKETDTIGGHTDSFVPYKRWYGYSLESDCIYYYVLKLNQHHFYTPVFKETKKDENSHLVIKILNRLLDGPSAKLRELDITTGIPSGTKLTSAIPEENGILSVNIEIELSKFLNAQQEENFLEQIILTITENTAFNKINLYFNGETLEALPFGTEINNPLSRRNE